MNRPHPPVITENIRADIAARASAFIASLMRRPLSDLAPLSLEPDAPVFRVRVTPSLSRSSYSTVRFEIDHDARVVVNPLWGDYAVEQLSDEAERLYLEAATAERFGDKEAAVC